MEVLEKRTVDISASDVSNQKRVAVRDVPAEATVGELIDGLLEQLDLPVKDSQGEPLLYQARLEREGRHLHTSELVGDALQADDAITLQPNIDAGCVA
jgi:hypothetical protein